MTRTMLGLATLFASTLAIAAPSDRRAVVVGANRAMQGRGALKFAHDDAHRFAEVLRQTGGLSDTDVTMLDDPSPDEVLRALDARAAELQGRGGDGLLVFYYSGHSDEAALYPRGEPLPLEALRQRLESGGAAIRLGIIDACGGGAWTRAKGVIKEAPFDVELPKAFATEGSALIASSSGVESAHESDALQGSFFTHHLVAGLRGVADRSGDGQVTLQEAYEYARQMTIRDTALHAPALQHPSFDMRLRGRSDLVLASLSGDVSNLALAQNKGPLQVVQLSTGLMVLELPEGQRQVRAALSPGDYLVRRTEADTVWAREIHVAANQTVAIEEASLVLVGQERLSPKHHAEAPPTTFTSLPARSVLAGLRLGVQYAPELPLEAQPIESSGLQREPALDADLGYGFTDRLQLQGLSLAYRFGERGAHEWLVNAGASGLGFGFGTLGPMFQLQLLGGATWRPWLAPGHSLLVSAGLFSSGFWSSYLQVPLSTWQVRASVGYSVTLYDTVTFNIGVGWNNRLSYRGRLPDASSGELAPQLSLLGVSTLGARTMPLVQVHLNQRWSIEGNAAVVFDFASGRVLDRFTVGFSSVW